MGRPYTRAQAVEILSDLKSSLPDLNLGTDLLIGFPGESEQDFEETLSLAEELPFGYLHVFPFSPRPGTKASKLNDQISPELKRSRVSKLKRLDGLKRAAFLESQVGRWRQAIIENSPHRSGRLKVLTDNYIPALLPPDSTAAPGQTVMVRLSPPRNLYGLAEASL
jgi:threonylcarbamoyladenosine tRNA methylthiotransferase MtaB